MDLMKQERRFKEEKEKDKSCLNEDGRKGRNGGSREVQEKGKGREGGKKIQEMTSE